MSITKKITKGDLLEIAKEYNADENYIFNIENIPEIITADGVDYNLSINGIFDNDKIKGVEINFFDNNDFKYLFDYKRYDNMYDALTDIHNKIDKLIK